MAFDLIYPEHKHPHGVENSKPNEYRIWVCEECGQVFTDEELRKDAEEGGWGNPCKMHPRSKKPWRCESHLEPYTPDYHSIKQGVESEVDYTNGLTEEAVKDLWCQHCKALQKSSDISVECWMNPFDKTGYCAACEDAAQAILSLTQRKETDKE
jgi:hypothetical protein